ncbi:serine hydrolase domain-containing protein [Desulfonatronovibrio magnus]|uniref:serine hydrolase domain-containing protein n=1 Tax=Desulfonatronovibrio magnus TaxID=698827 RepID=UPI000697F5BB|nr:serine hydrolase domain-containing protein [Desulfonatronovibrio magnus]
MFFCRYGLFWGTRTVMPFPFSPSRYWMFLLVLLFISSGCGGGSGSSHDETRQKVNDALDKVMVDNNIPGLVAKTSLHNDGPWTVVKGVANTATNEWTTAEHKFRVASVTKTFTAVMVLILADRGELGLDDTVGNYLLNVPNGDQITVRMLLNHTSGIRDEDPDGELRRALREEPLRKWTPWEVFNTYTGGKPQGSPGMEYEYSNAGYVLAGILIEEIAGKTVQEFLEESITGPLELNNTYFPEGPTIREPHAHGYDGDKDVTHSDLSWDFTAGAMVSSAGDLYKWARAFSLGYLLSPEMFAEQKRWIELPKGRGEIKGGLGMVNLFGWLGHSGGNIGWLANMYYQPEQDAALVVLMNKLSNDGSDLLAGQQAFARVADVLVPGSIPLWYLEAVMP